jgi:hypothetical protein
MRGGFGCCAVSGDEELRLPLRKATPLSGAMASLAALLSRPAAPAQAALQADVPNGSSSAAVQDENTAPPNGASIIASHTLKM